MAFLCPSMRMRRDKKKATNATVVPIPVGRITGSASIETLVRVGIEKEHGLSPDSKMIVLHDFTPCVDDELEVKRGQFVNVLYRENDWVYVIGQDTRQEGFIPYSYCVPHNSPSDLSVKKKLPREQVTEQSENVALLSAVETSDEGPVVLRGELSNIGIAVLKSSESSNLIHQPECTPFRKDPCGRYIVLYTFIARDENDISVERGEFVTLLNREDPDWFWIVRSDGQEGFIPAGFVYPADSVLQTHQKMLNGFFMATDNQQSNTILGSNVANKPHNTNNNANPNEHMARTLSRSLNRIAHPSPLATIDSSGNSLPQEQVQQHPQMALSAEDLRFHGTELVVLYDYKAQAPDDLSVRGGEWIYADLNNQTVDGWLWAYAPKTRKYGFIPQTYARPQPQTQL